MSRSAVVSISEARFLSLNLEIREPLLVSYFDPFAEPERSAKAIEAIKVGVIALQTACPSLDGQIVKEELREIENRLTESTEEFQKGFAEVLESYFEQKNGHVPKSLDGLFGDDGKLSHFMQRFFDPENGKLARVMDGHVGPSSRFAKLFDPQNKSGVISLIEDKVKALVEAKLNDVLNEFSLDHDKSAMCRLNKMIDERFNGLSRALGVKVARSQEAQRGHVKGFDFESDLYEVVASIARQLGDESESVRGTPGAIRRKTGDHVITLGEATGAPGLRIVIEAKDQVYRFKDAIAELLEAKKNREAGIGIFVFAKGCEPKEVGDLKRLENDFYCTVDKEALAGEGPLPYLWGAIQIARVQAVAAVRKESCGQLDVARIQKEIDGLSTWIPRLADMATKARTIHGHGKAIESTAGEIRDDLEARIRVVLDQLRLVDAN